jgi:hypothetical protein
MVSSAGSLAPELQLQRESRRYAASAMLVLQQHRSPASCPYPTRIVVYEKHQTFTNYKPQPNLPHRKRVDPQVPGDHPDHGAGLRQSGPIISILTRPWPSSPITWPLATTPIAPYTLITTSSASFTWRAEGKLNVIHRNAQTFVTAQKKGPIGPHEPRCASVGNWLPVSCWSEPQSRSALL